MSETFIEKLILYAGIGHFLLCFASLFIPKILRWTEQLKNLQPLLRQMFWTYAAYILVINFCFGIVSVFGNTTLLDHSFLAKSITLFIALYWLSRVLIQFFYFDKSDSPKGLIFTIGEIALVSLFAFFTITYFTAFCFNQSWI
jgi:hypothetical protein